MTELTWFGFTVHNLEDISVPPPRFGVFTFESKCTRITIRETLECTTNGFRPIPSVRSARFGPFQALFGIMQDQSINIMKKLLTFL